MLLQQDIGRMAERVEAAAEQLRAESVAPETAEAPYLSREEDWD